MEKRSIFTPAVAYRFAGIAEDMQHLDQLLAEVRQLVAWPRAGDSVTLCNLACGRADETGVLWKHFFAPHQRAWYHACDLRHAEINEARQRWQSPMGCDWQIEFRAADASLTPSLPSGGIADVVFIRHQNFWDAPAVWDRIFRNALRLLGEQGRLLITSYFEREHELAKACLLSLGAELLADVPNRSARVLPDAPGKAVDRRIAVFAREKGCSITPNSESFLA